MLQMMRKPEYLHVLLNPLPVYATAMGALALALALFMRNQQAQIVALILIFVGGISAAPVVYYGLHGYDRVYAMSDENGDKWLDVHRDRAEDFQYLFYATAALAVAALVALWKFPKATLYLDGMTLAAALGCLLMGGWISHAGGQVRHREFRDGPPAHEVHDYGH
jgi:hypothetical protein